MIHEHPVQLLRHRAVERAHARLDVHHRQARLRAREPAGERRVGIAVDEHRVWRELVDERLDRGEHARGLRAVRAARDPQFVVGLRESQLLEEHARERVRVVLAGVHQDLLVPLAQQAGDRGGLDELRPVPDDREYAHGR